LNLAQIFEKHGDVFVAFSGGKDSTALVELCEPWRDRVTLVSVDMGGRIFPHMREWIESYGKRFKLHWIVTDQAAQWQTFGLPARVVPTSHVDLYQSGANATPKMQAWISCCYGLLGAPMREFMRSKGPDAVLLTAQRKSEVSAGHVPSPDVFAQGGVSNGYHTYAPLAEWSEKQVLDFLDERGVTLPEQYRYGTKDMSLDCSNCPAMLISAERVEFMKARYPKELDEAMGLLKQTQAAAIAALADAGRSLEAA
jgi:3'-phosphoadenosine 5'-phosphosulfate sulfotransferase (PAPS reductase)/FAD synthetase